MGDYAILTDSGTDTPTEVLLDSPVYVVPLRIEYSGGITYLDGVDITPEEVAERFDVEVPTTSLPSLVSIQQQLESMQADGYQKVLVITLSSKLSGTYDAIRLVARDYPAMEFAFIDTKNIGLGAGMLCALAARGMRLGLTFHECARYVEQHVGSTKVFFCMPTLEYLAKGGRIGKVASIIGSALHVVPIITCNEEGVYVTAAKARNWNRALSVAIEKAVKYIGDGTHYILAVANSMAATDAESVKNALLEKLPHPEHLYLGTISPALTVHTGPQLIGVGAQNLVAPDLASLA